MKKIASSAENLAMFFTFVDGGPKHQQHPAIPDDRARGVLSSERCYQLDFCTPGSSPACAISRRQMRHSPNLR